MLIVFSGLPVVGKTSIARELARRTGAVYLRIDTIEDAVRDFISGPLDDAGYRVAYAVAEDNLRLGRTVVADSVNPIRLTREAWREVGTRCGAEVVDLEVTCSDRAEHRRRVEARGGEPTWEQVQAREYEPWDRSPVTLDTARLSLEEAVRLLLHETSSRGGGSNVR